MNENIRKTTIGGQGVLNGIMMRSPGKTALAVRKDDGDIELSTWENVQYDDIWHKIPVIRGVLNFVSMMYNGVKVLMNSADLAGEETEDLEPSKFDKAVAKAFGKKAEDIMMGFAVVISLAISIGLFFLLPTLITSLIKGNITSNIVLNLIDGGIRIFLLLLYLYLISKMHEIKVLFQYHGAEHKTITCYEKGLELNTDNVEKQKRLHPRCGTSYILIVMIVSILIYSLFPWTSSLVKRLLIKILVLPLVVGISYEILKLLAKSDNICFRILRWPGMQLQRLTTREPDRNIINVAIVAFEAALGEKSEEEIEELKNGFSLKEKSGEGEETFPEETDGEDDVQ